MLSRLTSLALLAACSLSASVIDSGRILTHYTLGMGDSEEWSVFLGSTEEGYSVQFHIDGATGKTSCVPSELGCPPDVFPYLPSGYTVTLWAHSIGDYGARGSATVDGVSYPAVGFKGTYQPGGPFSSVFYSSTLFLQSVPLVLAPGSFSIPFTARGRILAATAGGTELLINDEVSGSGTLSFTLRHVAGPDSPLEFAYFSSLEGDPTRRQPPQMVWQFQPAPEPSSWLLIAAGLGICAYRRSFAKLIRGERQ